MKLLALPHFRGKSTIYVHILVVFISKLEHDLKKLLDMEIESKLSALDAKQYYKLGPSSGSSLEEKSLDLDFKNLDLNLDLDQISSCDSEDVDTIVHRYDPPNFQDSELKETSGKSIAEELLDENEIVTKTTTVCSKHSLKS